MRLRTRSWRLAHAAAATAVLAGGPVVASAAGQDNGAAPREGLVQRMDGLLGASSRIGVTVQDVEQGSASATGLAEGAVVSDVRSGSAAADAGLEAGDVVVEFDGERVRSARQFARLVRETPPGREVAATVVRGAERRALRVTPEAGGVGRRAFLPEGALADLDSFIVDLRRRLPRAGAVERRFYRGDASASRRLGVRAQAIEGQMADYFGVEGGSGVLITGVEDESAAARAGLRAGDVITAVAEHPVADVRSLRRRLAAAPAGEDIVITVVRDGMETQVTAEFEVSEDGAGRRARIPI